MLQMLTREQAAEGQRGVLSLLAEMVGRPHSTNLFNIVSNAIALTMKLEALDNLEPAEDEYGWRRPQP